jgi:hypothetical protein
MVLKDAIDLMKKSMFPDELLNEIKPDGMGAELFRESDLDTNGNVRISHLMEWVHIMKHGMRVVRVLCKQFG